MSMLSSAPPQLLLFKSAIAAEFQCPAILGHCADNLVRSACGNFRINIERDLHIGSNQSNEMSDHLIRDSASVPPYSGGIKNDRPVEALRFGRLHRPVGLVGFLS